MPWKKRKLGQYAVVWEDNKLVYKGEVLRKWNWWLL